MSTPNSNDDPATESTENDGGTPAFGEEFTKSDPSQEPNGAPGSAETTDTADNSPSETGEHSHTTEFESQLNALRTENAALSADYARARKASYRKTALALVAVGVLAVLGGVAFPDVQPVLFITGAIGLFGGVLTWYLTPDRVVPIAVSESVYDATASTLTGIRDELGLQPQTVYIPVDGRVRGFIPRHHAFELPENAAHVFMTDGASRGVSFSPTGRSLTSEIKRIRRAQAPENATNALEQTSDTLVEHFEVVDSVTIDRDGERSRLVVSVENAAFGPVTRVDHPVVSALACSVVRATDGPVAVEPLTESTVALEPDPVSENFRS